MFGFEAAIIASAASAAYAAREALEHARSLEQATGMSCAWLGNQPLWTTQCVNCGAPPDGKRACSYCTTVRQ